MTLQRLVNLSTDESERAVLRSSDAELPRPEALAKTAAALGIPAALLIAPSATASSGVGLLSVAKALLVGLALGTVGIAAHQLSQSQSGTASARNVARVPDGRALPTSAPRAHVELPALVASAASSATVVERPHAPRSSSSAFASASELLPDAPPAAPTPQVAPSNAPNSASFPEPERAADKPPAASPQAASIAEQIQIVDEARRSLSEGRAAQTLRVVEAYRTRWPEGAFSPEISVLSVEANLRLGRHTQAEREAEALFQFQPRGKYADRARALLAQ